MKGNGEQTLLESHWNKFLFLIVTARNDNVIKTKQSSKNRNWNKKTLWKSVSQSSCKLIIYLWRGLVRYPVPLIVEQSLWKIATKTTHFLSNQSSSKAPFEKAVCFLCPTNSKAAERIPRQALAPREDQYPGIVVYSGASCESSWKKQSRPGPPLVVDWVSGLL